MGGRGSRKGNERRQVEGKRERVRDSSTGEAQRWWCGKERTKKTREGLNLQKPKYSEH